MDMIGQEHMRLSDRITGSFSSESLIGLLPAGVTPDRVLLRRMVERRRLWVERLENAKPGEFDRPSVVSGLQQNVHGAQPSGLLLRCSRQGGDVGGRVAQRRQRLTAARGDQKGEPDIQIDERNSATQRN